MKTFLIRGVPAGLQQDGWWLNTAPRGPRKPDRIQDAAPQGWRAGLLVGLIALGDVLIWQVVPGVSLALLCAAIVLAAFLVAGTRLSPERQALIAGGTLLVILPLVELVQPLSVMIAVGGTSAMLALIAGLRPERVARAVLRLWPLGVQQGVADACALLPEKRVAKRPDQASAIVMAWLMPVVLGLVFVLLLLAANPIAEQWVAAFDPSRLRGPDAARVTFWLCLAFVAWTALSVTAMRERLAAMPAPAPMGPARLGLINPASVVRALIMFNAVFAVQTVLDAVYLYGGVGLPEGISYAQYAHRGAYPLVVTALLAGGFALLTRPWVQANPMLRVLLMLWVAQNVALVISSLVRLELYVGVYGLTHLRMAAAIWMGLVAAGLGLILWQVWQRRDNAWLMLRGCALGAAVLYACAWVSFDAAVARYNLSHGAKWDQHYLCTLGDAAKPVIAAHEVATGRAICGTSRFDIKAPNDWREWGFRNWRARTSLEALLTEAPS